MHSQLSCWCEWFLLLILMHMNQTEYCCCCCCCCCWCYYSLLLFSCCRFTRWNTTPTTSSSTSIIRWSIWSLALVVKGEELRQYQLIFQYNQYQLSFFCKNCSSKSYSSLTCSGWINSNTCSHREDISTHRRRRLGRCSTNHGAVVVVVSVLKRSKRSNTFLFFS